MLLFNEPFTPGDLVTFRCGHSEFMGRVERVGWVSSLRNDSSLVNLRSYSFF